MLTPTSYASLTRSNSTPRTLLNKSILSCKARHCQRQSTPLSANIRPVEPIINSILVDLIALEGDFHLRAEGCIVFPLELSDTTIQKAINCFQIQITNIVKHLDYICCCYSQFVDPVELNLIYDNELILMAIFEIHILYPCDLNIYSYSKTFNFCHNC